jgi:tetratricopeptide (TPR) repeat protein
MRWHTGLAAVLLFTFSGAAAMAADAPWDRANTLFMATVAEIQKNGEDGIRTRLPELEAALVDGAAAFPPRVDAEGKLTILIDGVTEAAMVQSLTPPQDITIVMVPNPYPQIGLMLAFYYNEAGRPQEALRVIAAAIKLSAMADMHRGARLAALLTESAAAYVTLQRWPDSLAAAEAALQASQTEQDAARSFRSIGLALVELRRLDDAEEAYRNSLRLEPENKLAIGEMATIARLRAGAPAQ